jgi:hydroxymethylglutaryl-CoA reductase
VGGLTKLHPLVQLYLEALGNPGAEELMGIIAASGLAQNFAALRALTTTGILSEAAGWLAGWLLLLPCPGWLI